jgi:hypothetical protein
MVIAQDVLDDDGINVSVLAKKSEFTPAEENAVQEFVAQHSPLQILYSPSVPQNNAFAQLIRSNDPNKFSRSYPYNVTPVNDNAPFFFFTLKPGKILHLGNDSAMDWKVNLGVAVLAMLLVISLIAVLAFLVLPLLFSKADRDRPSPALLYFIAVGLGYILVEVTLIQRFVLFLGHPTYALTVVIFLMLLSSGAGSVFSRRCLRDATQLWIPLAAVVVALLIYLGILPAILEHLVGAAFPAKLVISGLLLVPLGFAMGMPFPTGLRTLAEDLQQGSIEWAWAMNAASSVLGSVLAIVIAILFGFNVTLACGAAAYTMAMLLRPKPHSHAGRL